MANFTAKDGSKHTNRDTMKRADARFGAQQPAPQKIGGAGMGAAGDDGMGGNPDEQDGAQDGAALAAEHGPAEELNIQHDHENGVHKVHARHPDGHEHDTEHGSAGEAHKFAADCAGVGGGGQE
jgi:hypothetical protein